MKSEQDANMRWVLLVMSALLAAAIACAPLGGTGDEAVQTAIAQTEAVAMERQAIVDTAVAATFEATADSPEPATPATTTLPPTEVPEPSAPVPDAPEETIADTQSDAALLVLYNHSDYDLCHLTTISPTTGGGQEIDLMEPGNMVPSGYSYTLFDIPPGDYDLRVKSCDGSIIEEASNVNLRGKIPWAIPGPIGESGVSFEGGVAMTVVNGTSEEVCLVWAGPPASEWIADVLDDDTIPPGESLTVMFPPGTWALMAQDCSGMQLGYEAAYDVTTDTEWHIAP